MIKFIYRLITAYFNLYSNKLDNWLVSVESKRVDSSRSIQLRDKSIFPNISNLLEIIIVQQEVLIVLAYI